MKNAAAARPRTGGWATGWGDGRADEKTERDKRRNTKKEVILLETNFWFWMWLISFALVIFKDCFYEMVLKNCQLVMICTTEVGEDHSLQALHCGCL